MCANHSNEYKLYKIAVAMGNDFGYEIPKGLLPENALTPEFAKAAKSFAAEFYGPERVTEITKLAAASPALAENMLTFLKNVAAHKQGGHLVSDMAQDGLQQMAACHLLHQQQG